MKAQSEMKGHVVVAADTEKTMHRLEEMFARMQGALTAMQTFVSSMCELDEDAPDLVTHVAPMVEILTVNFIRQYETPQHLEADLDTLRHMIVRPQLNGKGGH